MEKYKQEFIEFMVRSNVLTFGDFTTKSGRKTPFFINTGNYSTGAQLSKLGEYYAAAINQQLPGSFNVLFGPAYKGIPLVVTTTATLARNGHDTAFCFNRKEAKDHGEGGVLIGHKLVDGDRVVIVEDVTTAGTSIRESFPILKAAADVEITGLVVSVDRMERGTSELSALQELEKEFNIKTCAIVTIEEITEYLHNREIDGRIVLTDVLMDRIAGYRKEFGAQKS